MLRKNRFALVAIILAISGFFVGARYVSAPTAASPVPSETGQLLHYSAPGYGLKFSYPSSYELSEFDAPGTAQRAHHVISLMRKADLPVSAAGEAPPSITIDIFQNDLDKLSTEGWIRNSSMSNFKLGDGMVATTTIHGDAALSYRWSGLYEGTTVAIAKPRWVYVFSVTYLEMGAPIIQDFVAIRESVALAP